MICKINSDLELAGFDPECSNNYYSDGLVRGITDNWPSFSPAKHSRSMLYGTIKFFMHINIVI